LVSQPKKRKSSRRRSKQALSASGVEQDSSAKKGCSAKQNRGSGSGGSKAAKRKPSKSKSIKTNKVRKP